MKEVLNNLFEYKTLNREKAREILMSLAAGNYNSSQMAAFITVYLMRNITVEELMGFREAMLELCNKVDLQKYDAIDLCGTGGDGKNTFNISTMAAFIVAGAGQSVAKHGNTGVSSVCGSSNLLMHFGIAFKSEEEELKKDLDKANICFLHAPLFHPAMKNVAPVRKELGVKTFFNMLGPMVNPSEPKKQLVGVFSLELARLYHYIYQQKSKNYLVLHSLDGYDEISLTGPVRWISGKEDSYKTPADLGFKEIKPEQLYGGETVEEAAKIFETILSGKGNEAQNSVVLANAAAALYASEFDKDWDKCVEAAKASLFEGKAESTFNALCP